MARRGLSGSCWDGGGGGKEGGATQDQTLHTLLHARSAGSRGFTKFWQVN